MDCFLPHSRPEPAPDVLRHLEHVGAPIVLEAFPAALAVVNASHKARSCRKPPGGLAPSDHLVHRRVLPHAVPVHARLAVRILRGPCSTQARLLAEHAVELVRALVDEHLVMRIVLGFLVLGGRRELRAEILVQLPRPMHHPLLDDHRTK